MKDSEALDLAKQAYEASTSFVDTNYRSDWDYSIKAFRNEHAAGSKYSSPEYAARSRIFHPKTRSIIRKNEAAAFQAAFGNRRMVNAEPGNPDNPMNVAAASALQEVMQYRLTKTIPTFQIYVGGIQDAQTTGAVCSYQYWEYEKQGEKKIKDKPCIQLRPVENIRFDGGCDWVDPVNSSPFWCDIIPMYVCDVRAMMSAKDGKTKRPPWKKYDDKEILQARPDKIDSTRRARLGQQQDPHQESTKISEFDIVWVMRWFMRGSASDDYTYYTLGSDLLLSSPKDLEEVYFHGVRPYTMGYAVLETHRSIKSSLPVLVRPLQQAVNQVSNSRFDNVQFVLNKRWMVARGRQVDVQSLVRNVPGGVTLVTDPKTDVQEFNWQDVTSSAYVENDRLSAELDDLAGNFSPSTKVANNAVNDTLGGSRMAAAGAGLMSEYLIQTVNITWWEPTLRQLALLERYYETDETVLAVCAQKAQLYPRFQISQITDRMLMEDVSVNVDMALGDPQQRLQKFMGAIAASSQIRANAPPGMDVNQVTEEIMSLSGYRDGQRFFHQTQDPRLMQMGQVIQQLQGQLQGKVVEQKASLQETQMKLLSNERIEAAKLQVDVDRIHGDQRIRSAELIVEQQQLELEKLKLQIELRGSDQEMQMEAVRMQHEIDAAQMKLQGEREKQVAESFKNAHEVEKSALELEKARTEQANESRIGAVADEVGQSMAGVRSDIERMKEQMAGVPQKAEIDDLKKGLGAMLGFVMQPKKRAKGIRLSKADGKKTNAVVVDYDDGSSDEMPVVAQ